MPPGACVGPSAVFIINIQYLLFTCFIVGPSAVCGSRDPPTRQDPDRDRSEDLDSARGGRNRQGPNI